MTQVKVKGSFRRLSAAIFVLCTIFALGTVAFVFVWKLRKYPDQPGPSTGPQHEIKITVGKAWPLSQIAKTLENHQLIQNRLLFRLYVSEIQQIPASKIKAGEYYLSAKMTPRQILERLTTGTLVQDIEVLFPEGKNMLEVATLLTEKGVCLPGEAEKLMRSVLFIKSLQIPAFDSVPENVEMTLEGYLFPDKYRFIKGAKCEVALKKMVNHAKEVLAKLKQEHLAGWRVLGVNYNFDERKLVTLASIVEKETGQAVERPRIASVFLNRLILPTFKPHRLETDPTIIYGCKVPLQKSEACLKFEGRIRRIHLDDKENPYNTYRHDGLPPGPISNPGKAALEAVLKPDNSPYLYFVSKNNGTHHFSVTLEEHQAAVNKYQRSK